MGKNIGLLWIKDDFRFHRNLALSEATKKHDHVVAFYLYKKHKFLKQEAQSWWVGKSLEDFKKRLDKINIKLEIIETSSYKSFFEKLFKKKDICIYWNKTYEPDYLKFDKYLSINFKINQIHFQIFKGNILNEIEEVKKADGTPFKVFTPYWRNAEKFYIEKVPSIQKNISKCKKKLSFFKKTMNLGEIFPKNRWSKKFEKYWILAKKML